MRHQASARRTPTPRSRVVRVRTSACLPCPAARNGNEGPRRRCISVHLRAQRRLSDTGASALHIHQSNEDRRGLQWDSNPRSPPHLRKSGHPVARQREGGAETPGPQDRDPNVGPLRPPIPRRLGCRGQRFRRRRTDYCGRFQLSNPLQRPKKASELWWQVLDSNQCRR
jgi:hypothetical protein